MSKTGRRANRSAAGAFLMSLIVFVVLGAGTANAQQVLAAATGVGTVPAGEYAGMTIRAAVVGSYSGLGLATLIGGRAVVWIGAKRFDSVVSSSLPSFCCGEGHVGTDFFSMTGQVLENTPAGSHNHLFGTSASTDGTMCINIADQTNSVVPPATPPHDPGVGLICGIRAFVAIVPLAAPLYVSNSGSLPNGIDLTADASTGGAFPAPVSASWRARSFRQDSPFTTPARL